MEISVDFFENRIAECRSGENHSIVIGGELREVCACGSGCGGTLNLRKFSNDINGVVRTLEEDGEYGIDIEEEEE